MQTMFGAWKNWLAFCLSKSRSRADPTRKDYDTGMHHSNIAVVIGVAIAILVIFMGLRRNRPR